MSVTDARSGSPTDAHDPAGSPVPALGADDEHAVTELAEIFALLGDPARMRILLRLSERPHRVGQLAAAIGLSPSATSHALRVLRLHRIVRATRVGRHATYELADEHVRQLLELARTHVHHSPPDHSRD